MNNKWDTRYGDLAQLISTWSKDPSTQVGAVIVRPDKSIASMGFNGFPRSIEDRTEWLENREEKLKRVIHAEHNALTFCAHEDVTGFTAYVYPLMPCIECARRLVDRGISRIVTVTTPEKAEYMAQPDVILRYSFRVTEDYLEQHGVTHEIMLKP